MDLDRQMRIYKEKRAAAPEENRIRETVNASVESFFRAESGRMLAYHSFLYLQLRLIRKRWWLIQAAVLAGLWMLLPLAESEAYICRTLGIGGTLFMILMIPELWKNRTNQCMEVETAAYYDLRRVYAARMLLFGGADILLITAFGSAAVVSLQISLEELLIQFLFPVTVTACICFGALGSRHLLSEASAVGVCILWSALWWCVLMNERVYALLTVPVWGTLLAGAAVFLIFVVCRAIRQCGSIWEVSPDGIEIE